MRRREFIRLIAAGAAVAWPPVARGQQTTMRRVGVLTGLAATDGATLQRIAALKHRLEELGWVDGHNLDLAVRGSESKIDKAESQAKELVAWNADVLIAHALIPALALRKATTSIPIIFTNVSDPDGAGLVQSVAHPGGNVTGFSNLEPTIAAKWLQILHEIAPRITRAAVVYNPEGSLVSAPFVTAASEAGPQFSLTVSKLPIQRADELQSTITNFAMEPEGALLFPPDIFTSAHRDLILPLTERYKIPAIYPYRYFVDDGGLISYGTNPVDSFAQAATYVDRILRGANPADLPVQAPTKYELVINLKAAKSIGLVIPPNVLDLADDLLQ